MVAEGNDLYYLETNTLPGLTVTSLVPQELRVTGIGFREFLEKQIELALERCRQAA
jgi:D-alanine-D-alanine ligase